MIDAYRQPYVPFYLATREFFALCRKHLTPGGIVALNVSTVPGDTRLASGIAGTLATAFPQVVVWPALRFNELVVGLSAAAQLEELRRRLAAARRPSGGASAHAAAGRPAAAPRAVSPPLDRRPGAGRVDHRRHDRRLRLPRQADPRALSADRAVSGPGRAAARRRFRQTGRTNWVAPCAGTTAGSSRRPRRSRNLVVPDYKRYKAGQRRTSGKATQTPSHGATHLHALHGRRRVCRPGEPVVARDQGGRARPGLLRGRHGGHDGGVSAAHGGPGRQERSPGGAVRQVAACRGRCPASRSTSSSWAATGAPVSPTWGRAPTRCCSCASIPRRAASRCSPCRATCW